ncbi:hypothetical protein AA0113_g11832 [Alternaria arborescens]|uniref:Transcription factor domain-containing protein n=1 Tax=Alternaria arborescens TaxID=156630 RepID=A0A4Q4Q390_9PLEO|nr:hypothetical protein AA0113_g11832 [Alternaria arborescens]
MIPQPGLPDHLFSTESENTDSDFLVDTLVTAEIGGSTATDMQQPDDAITSRSQSSFTSQQCSPAMFPSQIPSTLPTSSIPSFLGGLGDLQHVEGSTESWQWVINELKRCPHDLAMRGETLFLHKELYRNMMPAAIRTALGLSATYCLLNESNRHVMFQAIDAEVFDLLQTPSLSGVDIARAKSGQDGGMTLIEELARLQALMVYQMIRMYDGGLEQRALVDLQRGIMTTRALQLLRILRAERDNDHGWHAWIIAESIRRTVLTIYMFYAVYSIAIHGFCIDFPTIAKLPVSTSRELWHSGDLHSPQCWSNEMGQTLSYEAYTEAWMVSPHVTLLPFQKFLVVPCKGLEGVAAYSDTAL